MKHVQASTPGVTDASTAASRSNVSKEELENATGLDPSILELAAEFSGRRKGGNRFVAMTTEDWLSHPFDGPRLAPWNWLPHEERRRTPHALPLIHEVCVTLVGELPLAIIDLAMQNTLASQL